MRLERRVQRERRLRALKVAGELQVALMGYRGKVLTGAQADLLAYGLEIIRRDLGGKRGADYSALDARQREPAGLSATE